MPSESKIQKELKREIGNLGLLTKISDRFTSGVPDYFFVGRGKTIFIETKATGEKLRKLQIYFMRQIIKNGGLHFIIDSSESIQHLKSFITKF